MKTEIKKNKIYTGSYKVTTYDADPFGYAKPSSLMNYMQDASGMHAFEWGLSVFDLFTEGKSWVISRYHLNIYSRPPIGKEIIIKTWPSTLQNLFILREFEASTNDHQIIAKATISVAMIDTKTKKPIPLKRTESLENTATPTQDSASTHFSENLFTPIRAIADDFAPLPKVSNLTRELVLPVMLRDLDVNGHVNHVVYAQWALEAVPTITWKTHHLTSIEINFKAEVLHGNQIISKIEASPHSEKNEIVFFHQIFHKENGSELTRLRTIWSLK